MPRLVEAALKNIYEDLIDVAEEIEPNLFKITWERLNSGIETAFGNPAWSHPDIDFIYELKQNTAVFSAFKTHAEQNEIAAQLINAEGELKSFADFKKDTAEIIGKNHRWLETEYDTALLRARNSAKWKEFERDADLFPNLKWMPSTSAERREYHQVLYGTVLPITHPFWTRHYPGNLWNCKCGITNTDEEVSKKIPAIDDGMAPDEGLDKNPAKTGKLFAASHPYFSKKKKTKKAANKAASAAVKADKKAKKPE